MNPRRRLHNLSIAAAFCFLLGCASKPAADTAPAIKYERQLVRRPGDSVEDAKVYIVIDHKRCWVIRAEWLAKNGYKWPDDVKTISATELDRIPLGQPVE